jgi:hypothetical protein
LHLSVFLFISTTFPHTLYLGGETEPHFDSGPSHCPSHPLNSLNSLQSSFTCMTSYFAVL